MSEFLYRRRLWFQTESISANNGQFRLTHGWHLEKVSWDEQQEAEAESS